MALVALSGYSVLGSWRQADVVERVAADSDNTDAHRQAAYLTGWEMSLIQATLREPDGEERLQLRAISQQASDSISRLSVIKDMDCRPVTLWGLCRHRGRPSPAPELKNRPELRAGHTGGMLLTRPGRRMAILTTGVVVSGVALALWEVPEPQRIAQYTAEAGPFGPIAVIAASTVLLAVLVPRSVLAAGSGLVFGPLLGSLYTLAAAAAAAFLAFCVGRWLGRDLVMAQPRLQGLDAWLTNCGPWGVTALRLLPIAPFGLISYGLGTTGISRRAYLAGTVAGATPSTIIYASLGSSALEPGSAGFAGSLAAAVTFAVAGMAGSAVLRRRRLRRGVHETAR
ncbi:TVP38/TMEM64 family protein [Actinoplanes campanulatus]|uniref:TVP38/TMEM64 family protein n=1 Tax=Actinoplanes campanulatus TaxID=113559 RepID=UPI001952FC17|nr:TVP38/TMEM64 family protein [Actinoplanes capillaceus]